jgi:hypothetical protein
MSIFFLKKLDRPTHNYLTNGVVIDNIKKKSKKFRGKVYVLDDQLIFWFRKSDSFSLTKVAGDGWLEEGAQHLQKIIFSEF